MTAATLTEAEREAEELRRQIADLRAFEAEYRSRLIAYIEGLLRALNGMGDVP